jgi:parallel beta-helix repeat protein
MRKTREAVMRVCGSKLFVSLGLALALAALVVGQPPSAKTITVCPSGCQFTKIQDAINAATAGDTIEVQAGTYVENLTITKSLTLRGADPAATIIDGSNGVAAKIPTIVVEKTENVTITGFTITRGYRGVWGRWVTNLRLLKNVLTRNIRQNILYGANTGIGPVTGEISENQILESIRESEDGRGHGIHLMGKSEATISNNLIQGNGMTGIMVYVASKVTITNNTIKENALGGLYVYNAIVEVRDNTFTSNGEIGIWVDVDESLLAPFASVRSQVIIERNEIVDTKVSTDAESLGEYGHGIVIKKAAAATITKNTLARNATAAIDISQMWVYGKPVVIRENTLTETRKNEKGEGGLGIRLSDTRDALIEKNTVSKNAEMGIGLFSLSSAAINGNTITDNNRFGIFADSSSWVTACSGNTISGHQNDLSDNLRGRCN